MKQTNLLWLCLALLLFSCSKDTEEANPNLEANNLVQEAQAYFQAHVQAGTIATESSLKRYGAKFTMVDWAKAKEKKISLGKAVVAPLIFENDVYVGLGKNSKRYDVNSTTFLYMFKDSQQYMHVEVVRYIPSDSYVPGYQQPFIGLVIIEDISGTFKGSYYFDGEKTIPLTQSSQSEQVSVNSAIAVTSGWCTTTTYYSCPEVGNYPEDCTEVAKDIYCQYDDLTLLTRPTDYETGSMIGDGYIGDNGGGEYTPSPATLFVAKIDDSKLDPCMQPIMNDMKNLSQGVGQIVTKFAGSTPGYNWAVKDGVLDPNRNAFTDSKYDRINNIVTTTFDSNKFFNSSDLSVARTILHESVHAYLVAYMGIDPLNYNVTYAQLVQDWMSKKRPDLNSIQHDEMVRSFVNDIALALQEYGQLKNYNHTAQFYQDIAWGGLEGTSAFKNLPLSDRNRISDNISIEMSGKDRAGNSKTQKGQPSGC